MKILALCLIVVALLLFIPSTSISDDSDMDFFTEPPPWCIMQFQDWEYWLMEPGGKIVKKLNRKGGDIRIGCQKIDGLKICG